MYEFKRFGILIRHNGIPLHAGSQLISRYDIVLWWPINWIALVVGVVMLVVQKMKRMVVHDQR